MLVPHSCRAAGPWPAAWWLCTGPIAPLPGTLQALAYGYAVLVPESLNTTTGCFSSTGGTGVNDQDEMPAIVQV